MRVSATRPSSSIKNQTWMEPLTVASFKSGGYSAINSLVSSLHKAIRKAQGDERSETSVLYVRKH